MADARYIHFVETTARDFAAKYQEFAAWFTLNTNDDGTLRSVKVSDYPDITVGGMDVYNVYLLKDAQVIYAYGHPYDGGKDYINSAQMSDRVTNPTVQGHTLIIPTIRGQAGSQGVQGTRGYTGSNGEQGAQGLQGMQGLQGVSGSTGLRGEQGSQGYQGVGGEQGTQGLQGDQGLQGLQGPKGDTQFGVDSQIGIQVADGTYETYNGSNDVTIQGVFNTSHLGGQGIQYFASKQDLEEIKKETKNCWIEVE